MDEVDQDGDGDAAGGGLGLDPPDLVLVAVGQRDPGPLAVRGRGGPPRRIAAATTSAASAATLAVSHLPAARGPGGRGPGSRIAAAVRGTGVMSKTAPTSAIRLRVRTSPRDSRPSCFGTALRASRCRPRAQLPGPDHDALAVTLQDQHVAGRGAGRGPAPAGVEVPEVSRGRPGQLLALPRAQRAPGLAGDIGAGQRERPARGRCRGLAGQPVRMFPGWQVQLRIGRVHARHAGRPVGDPGHPHRPEHAGQRPGMPPLGPPAGNPVRAAHLRPPRLGGRPRIQVILQQQPLDLPAPGPPAAPPAPRGPAQPPPLRPATPPPARMPPATARTPPVARTLTSGSSCPS